MNTTIYRYTDKFGESLTGTLPQIGHALLWGVRPGRTNAAICSDESGIYRGYGVGATTDNPEPWINVDDYGTESPRTFTLDEWLEWARRVEDQPSVVHRLEEVH